MAKRPFTGALVKAQGLDNSSMSVRMRVLGALLLSHWTGQAYAQLDTSAAQYVGGLRIKTVGPTRVVCALQPKKSGLPFMVELGFGQGGVGSYTGREYDMRSILLGGSKAKTSKKGHRYVNVPFRKSAAQAYTTGASNAMSIIQGLPTIKRTTRGKSAYPGGKRFAVHLKPHHKATALAGLYKTKEKHTHKSTIIGTLFRTASENGQPWMTKGIKPRSIAEYLVSSGGGNVGQLLTENF